MKFKVGDHILIETFDGVKRIYYSIVKILGIHPNDYDHVVICDELNDYSEFDMLVINDGTRLTKTELENWMIKIL